MIKRNDYLFLVLKAVSCEKFAKFKVQYLLDIGKLDNWEIRQLGKTLTINNLY